MPKPRENENVLPDKGELLASKLFDVKRKVCLVTGGGSGIGAMIAATLVENGAKVYIVSRKDTSDFASELTSRGFGACISLRADLAKDSDILEFKKSFETLEPNGFDILINNSGTTWEEDLDTYPMTGWDKVYDLNVRSIFYLTQQLLPLLEAKGTNRDPSRIINISSIESIKVGPSRSFAYSSSKAAVTHLTRHLAGHLARRNITVNTVLPGYFESRLTREYISKNKGRILDEILFERLGDIRDIGSVILLLCGKSGAWITGTEIVVDGGHVLGLSNKLLSTL